MAIPAVSREAILAAMAQFDREYRPTPEWSDWENNPSQRYALEDGGLRYPPKQIVSIAAKVPVSGFSGGRETNRYLEECGFRVIPIRERLIADLLEQILQDYPAARAERVRRGDSPMASLIKRVEATFQSEEVVTKRSTVKVRAGSGFGEWARVPWIAFLDTRETDTTQRGIYVVLLVREDCSGFYLTLNQGVTEPKEKLGTSGAASELRARAEAVRGEAVVQALADAGFMLSDDVDLRAGVLAAAYEASTIAHKLFEKGGIPDDVDLLADLEKVLDAYERYLSSRGTSVVHLLLKWKADKEPRTIERHKEIADREGSVWWGKFGEAGISGAKLAQIRRQLQEHTTTCVFLSGAGSLWRTVLEEITTNAADVDARFPDYYRREDCAFFCRLSHFEQTSREWLIENTVLESDPAPGSAQNAIVSAANPAYLLIGQPANRAPAQDTRELCLIGSGEVDDYSASMEAYIREHGAAASWWSFFIRPEAEGRLKRPFFLYINSGGGKLPVRLRVTDYVTRAGSEGLVSPWSEITQPEYVGKTRAGERSSEIFKTWIRVDRIERLSPPLRIEEFEPAPGLSQQGTLLHQSTFGYAYRRGAEETRAEDPMDALVADTLLERAFLESMVSALRGSSPQIVLAGPPGTSKTWIARALARHIAGSQSRVRLVQFHPNYSYEAFIEGLRPVADSGGAITFRLQPGALMEVVESMRRAGETGDSSPLHVIVIDEMNRANLPRVFGELMYLFEYRNSEIRLQYSERFSLPSNLRFIGTMNTADRSIRSIDIALRRRFDVFELGPDVEILRRYFGRHPLEVPGLHDGFLKLNAHLQSHGLDRHHSIGHAFFMKPGLDRQMLRAIWERKIFPLIEEYFFDEPDIPPQYSIEQFWG